MWAVSYTHLDVYKRQVPESEAGTSHLQILSKVATALTDEAFRAAVKSTDDPAAIAELINERLA